MNEWVDGDSCSLMLCQRSRQNTSLGFCDDFYAGIGGGDRPKISIIKSPIKHLNLQLSNQPNDRSCLLQ
jgi:hypothetical protein